MSEIDRAAKEIAKDMRARAYIAEVLARWREQDIANGAVPVSLEEYSRRYTELARERKKA